MKIIKIENKVTKTSKDYQLIELDVDGKIVKGSMWGIHDFKEGDIVDWQIVANGQYNNFYTKEPMPEVVPSSRGLSATTITIEDRVETLEKEIQKLKSMLSTGLAQIKSDVVFEITGKFLTTADYNKLSEPIPALVDTGEVKDGGIPF
jgi:hypothetical protein